MQLDLGAIAKGYAADLAAQVYNRHGIYQGLIDLGGNVLAMGGSDRMDDGLWRVAIQSPFKQRGKSVAVLGLRDASAVTSGIYERKFESGGKSYHHLIDPLSGYPLENDLASVTVVAATSTEADLWATILHAGGLEKSLSRAEEKSGIEAVFVTLDGRVAATSGIRTCLQLPILIIRGYDVCRCLRSFTCLEFHQCMNTPYEGKLHNLILGLPDL